MPKVRRSKKAPPEGWELIEPTLEELEQKMREGKLKILFCVIITCYFYSGDGTTRRQKETRSVVANFQNTSPKISLYLRFILPKKSHQ